MPRITKGPAMLERLIKKWVRASRLYNRDCNMRVMRKQDARQNELMLRAEKTFQDMMRALKAHIT